MKKASNQKNRMISVGKNVKSSDLLGSRNREQQIVKHNIFPDKMKQQKYNGGEWNGADELWDTMKAADANDNIKSRR